MAFHGTRVVTTDAWTELTDGDVTACRVDNQGGYDVILQATVGATAPTSSAGSQLLSARKTLTADMLLSDLFPGVAGANRLWARSGCETSVEVSHA